MTVVGRRAGGEEAGEQSHRLENRELVGELGLLELNPEALAQLAVAAPVPVSPQHRDETLVRRCQTLEDLHRGRLAGAVGSEQPEALTALHGQVDPGHGDNVVEALDQPGARQRRAEVVRGLLIDDLTVRGATGGGVLDFEVPFAQTDVGGFVALCAALPFPFQPSASRSSRMRRSGITANPQITKLGLSPMSRTAR